VKRSRTPSDCRALVRAAGLAALAALCLAGCMVGPDFQRPRVEMPPAYVGRVPQPSPPPADPLAASLASWWGLFDDPALVTLVERALQSNLDVKVAEARVRQARAAVQGAQSFLWPAVDSSASVRRSRTPGPVGNRGNVGTLYQAGFDAGWELDLFGGVRRSVEAAEADLAGAEEARRDVLVSLAAEVAQTYIDLRAFQERVAIARGNLETQTRSASITRQRFQAGFVSGLDLANAEAQAATTAAAIPLLESAAQQSVYRLSILLGLNPADLLPELTIPGPIPLQPPAVPPGLPSELLQRRPDIRLAEARAHAATARIGAATAELFPRFTIGGSAGVTSADLGSIGPGNRFWSIGPTVSWNVFDAGRTRAVIEQQEAIADEALLAYRQTVLGALQEVESALVASTKEQQRRDELVRAVAGNRKALDLSMRLYTQGQTDFLSVIEAQRALTLTEDALANSTGTVLTELVALYKALGGGWENGGDSAR
jgi:NodT family efflux transporter outer membrane factor (OMF) lipoprotein